MDSLSKSEQIQRFLRAATAHYSQLSPFVLRFLFGRLRKPLQLLTTYMVNAQVRSVIVIQHP